MKAYSNRRLIEGPDKLDLVQEARKSSVGHLATKSGEFRPPLRSAKQRRQLRRTMRRRDVQRSIRRDRREEAIFA